jgi:hypothetical protein
MFIMGLIHLAFKATILSWMSIVLFAGIYYIGAILACVALAREAWLESISHTLSKINASILSSRYRKAGEGRARLPQQKNQDRF